MNNSKLYSILEHFDKYEQNRCRKYIISPYFNKNQALIDLYDVLIKNINSANAKELTREMVWKKIHQDRKFDDVRCRKYLSDLLKLVEGYLIQQTYEENELLKAANLIYAVGEKKIDKLYSSAIRKAKKISNEYSFRSANYYYNQYLIELNYYDLVDSETNRSDRSNIDEISYSLDNFYLIEKLRLYCSVLSRKRVSSHKYSLSFIEEIVGNINSTIEDYIPAVQIYFQVYITFTNIEDESNYFKLKSLLTKYGLNFPHEEAYQIYTYAMNYCIGKANKGNIKFLNELFELYKQLIQREIIYTEGELSPWHFKNIVQCGLRLGEYDWIENFISKFQYRLPESFRENAVSYNLAQLYFYQKKHSEVIDLLRTIEYEDVTYNLGSKSMLLATYYETDEIEPLYSLLESFRVYLNRHNDIPLQRRKNYKNLIRFTKKMTKVMPGDNKSIEKIKQEISSTKGVASANWLKEKIAELEK